MRSSPTGWHRRRAHEHPHNNTHNIRIHIINNRYSGNNNHTCITILDQ